MPKRIIIVDDEPAIARLVKMCLSLDGFNVREATSGDQALALLGEEVPDLMVLDVMMPGMTGWDLCAKIKQNPRAKDVKIIFLTARGNPGDAQLGFDAGGDEFMVKPFDPDDLIAKVRVMLGVAV